MNTISTFTPTGRANVSHTRPLNLDQFLFGACYYPEHWDAETRRDDARRMREAGFNVVRMTDFAWDVLEPEEGRFDFTLFDATIATLGDHGIRAILCTPTAGAPRWLTEKHPETLRVEKDGNVMRHGSRQQCSHAHPIFREYSRKVTRAMAEHYATNANVIGWQTDNEIYCHMYEDHGADIQIAFREFLRRKYNDEIAVLNHAWGTAFWAQTYSRFEQIETPIHGRPTYLNPSHLLDYRRALSWIATEFQHDQVVILRAANPSWFVTHNGVFAGIDYRGDFTRDLDFLSYDIYPFFDNDSANRPASQAFNSDRTRAWSGNFLVPEHQSGPGGQPPYFHNNPEPGELRRMTYASIARGADSLLFFRWRTCRFGAEEYWCGILDHDSVSRRRYKEVAQIGAELAAVGPAVMGSSVHFDVGIALGDYDVRESDNGYPLGLPSSQNIAEAAHGVFYRAGYAVGACHPADNLDGVKLYLIPHWALFDAAWVPALTKWVEAGGVLVIGARTATRNPNNQIIAETLPGCLTALAGMIVEEYGAENDPLRVKTMRGEGIEAIGEFWYEVLEPAAGTEVLATWSGRHLDGKAAITLCRKGRGAVVYVGSYLTSELTTALLSTLAKLASLEKPLRNQPVGLEVVRREKNGRSLWFLMNPTDAPIIVPHPPIGSILAGEPLVPGGTLAPQGVTVILADT
jgi:beta-galactosidase